MFMRLVNIVSRDLIHPRADVTFFATPSFPQPLIILVVLCLDFIVLSVARIVLKRLSRKARYAVRKLPCAHFTSASGTAETIKLAILVILFLYPTICSKVFMTFKCIDVNDKLFLVADMAHTCFEGACVDPPFRVSFHPHITLNVAYAPPSLSSLQASIFFGLPSPRWRLLCTSSAFLCSS